MRLFSATLMKKVDNGKTDELGNKLYDYDELEAHSCKSLAWTSEDVNVLGREMVANNRKVLIRPLTEDIGLIEKIRIDNKVYDIESKQDLGRWIMLVVKGYRI